MVLNDTYSSHDRYWQTLEIVKAQQDMKIHEHLNAEILAQIGCIQTL
jgi:hypothetical protein